MGTYFEECLSDIKLIDSIILDGDGNQISLTHAQWDAVNDAAKTAALGTANPLTAKDYVDGAISSAIGNLQSGVAWKEPVNTLAAVEPTEGLVEGYRYINSVDGKIYTYLTDDFDAGVAPSANWVASTKDTDKTYMYDLETTTWIEQPNLNSIPVATDTIFGKVKIGSNIGVTGGTISVADASESVKGVVQLATDGEVASGKAVQSNDGRLLKGRYQNTYTGVTNFEVTHNLGSSKLMVQVWQSGKIVSGVSITKKVGSETTVLQLGINKSTTLEVCVIAIP